MTPTEKQIQAARANGAKSRGPKTAQGKLASSRNATTHGLTARTVVLHNESEAQFEADLRAYLDHFRPQTKPETDLVHQLAAAQWRLNRYIAIEAALLENKMGDQAEWLDDKYEALPEPNRLAIAFESLSGPNGSLALLNRYQARLQREYQRTLKTLTDLQAARRAAESKLSGEQSHRRRSEAINLAPSVAADQKGDLPNEPKRFPEQPAALPVAPHAPDDSAPALLPKLPCVPSAPLLLSCASLRCR